MSKTNGKTAQPAATAKNGTPPASEADATAKAAEAPKPSAEDLMLLLGQRKKALDVLKQQEKDIEAQFAAQLEPFAGMVIKHPETGIISKVIKGQYGYGLRAMESQALRDARVALGG